MADVKNITVQVDGAPYFIKAIPGYHNSELQYKVSLSEGEDTMFIFNTELGRFTAVGNAGILVPENVESAIGDKLNGLSLNL